jgi:hypothetical protein
VLLILLKITNWTLLVCKKQKKEKFEEFFLSSINSHFEWKVMPAVGAAGGILVGMRSSKFQVLSWQHHRFTVSVMIKKVYGQNDLETNCSL